MTRFFVRVVVALMVLFTVVLVLIRAQPYDDSELRAFLMPPKGCAAPCFMGIQLYRTPFKNALRILKESGLVEIMEISFDVIQGDAYVAWQWNIDKLPFLDKWGISKFANAYFYKGMTGQINILSTKIGIIHLTFGEPTKYRFYVANDMRSTSPIEILVSNALYLEPQLSVKSQHICPMASYIWNTEAVISLGDPNAKTYLEYFSDHLFIEHLLEVESRLCQ